MPENLPNHEDRAHALLSASSAHRWLKCPPSAVASEAYPNEDDEFTREGTLAHEIAELYARELSINHVDAPGPDQLDLKLIAEGFVTEEMKEYARNWHDYIQEHLAADDAAVLLEQHVDYSDWAPGGFGTCDCIIIQADTLTIMDYKYGKGVPVAASDNPQMRFYALGAYNEYRDFYDIKKIETHIFQPRIGNVDVEGLDLKDLLLWGDAIKPIAKQAYQGKGKYSAGLHCRFCPHTGRCRTLTKLCTDYVEGHDFRVKVPILAPHELSEVLSMEPVIKIWLEAIRGQAFNALMDGNEIPGYKLVEGRGSRDWVDEIVVVSILNSAGYESERISETKVLSPAKMEKALGKKKALELVGDCVVKTPGSPTVAPETDKRPAYNRLAEAQNDFND